MYLCGGATYNTTKYRFFSRHSFSASAQTDSAVQYAQPDTGAPKRYYQPPPAAAGLLDSVANALANRQYFIADSLSKVFIVKPDPLRHNQFYDILLKTEFIPSMLFRATR